MSFTPMPSAPGNLLLQWNSIKGESYVVYYTDSLLPANWQQLPLPGGGVVATTPLSTIQVPIGTTGQSLLSGGPGRRPARLDSALDHPVMAGQPAPSLLARQLHWLHLAVFHRAIRALAQPQPPVTDELSTHEWVVFDSLGTVPKYYRLIP